MELGNKARIEVSLCYPVAISDIDVGVYFIFYLLFIITNSILICSLIRFTVCVHISVACSEELS